MQQELETLVTFMLPSFALKARIFLRFANLGRDVDQPFRRNLPYIPHSEQDLIEAVPSVMPLLVGVREHLVQMAPKPWHVLTVPATVFSSRN